MVLSPDDILYKNLGVQVEVNEIIKKEKFWRKKIHHSFKVGIDQYEDVDGQVYNYTQHVGVE